MSQSWDPTFEATLRESVETLPPTVAVDPTADLFSLGFSSMQLVYLFVTLEMLYGVEFPAELLTAATTPSELWNNLRELVADRDDAA